MAPLVGPHNEKFEDFYTTWMDTQADMLKTLHEALESDMRQAELLQEVKKVIDHYEDYYKAKRNASHQDILQTVTPHWRSPLEKAFLWLGGWRPSLAFQLVYALAGQQIEVELAEFLEGVDTPTFASLSSVQLSQISELQTSTNKQEENLSNDMAILQQSFADQPLLTLAQAHHMVQLQEGGNGMNSPLEDEAAHGGGGGSVENINSAGDSENGSDDNKPENMDSVLQEKLTTLEGIAVQADSLRFFILKKVLDILDPYQKAQYLIAAGKLQSALRNVGEKLNGPPDS